MDIALWVTQALLALIIGPAGVMKLVLTREALAAKRQQEYAAEIPPTQLKLIGLAEVLGALGVILPWLTGIMPILTPIAALGLAVIMAGAVATRLRRKEPAIVPIVLTLMALFVAVGRFGLLG
ncbi:MAG TPA: DoxX family protein [Gemmatimonadaceae bacterium]|nr:DoxX family protein [Gemmatimonadaceae bacterium]